MIRHFACIFAVAIFLHSVGASAATPSWGRTIEANAALADVVVVGRLQSVAPSDAPQVFQDGAHSLLASIDVQKCLKGTATSPVTFSAVAVQDRLPQSAIYFLMAGTRYAAVIDRSAGKIPWVLQQKYLCFDYADLTQTASHGVVNTDLVDGLSAGRLIELVQAHCSNGVCPQYEGIMSFFGDYHRWPFLLEVPIDEPMQAVGWRSNA